MANPQTAIEYEFVAALLASPELIPLAEHIEPAMIENSDLRTLYERLKDRGGYSTPVVAAADLTSTERGKAAAANLAKGYDGLLVALETFFEDGRNTSPIDDLTHLIRERHLKRQAREAFESLHPDAFPSARDYASSVSAALDAVALKGAGTGGNALSSGVDAALDDWRFAQNNPGVITGYRVNMGEYDELMGGLKPGEVTLVGAASGIGKSFMLSHMAMEAALTPHDQTGIPPNVVFFSLEMSARQMSRRWISKLANTDINEPLTPAQTSAVEDKGARLKKLSDANRLVLVEPHNCQTIEQIARELSIRKRRDGTKIAFIDYIQLMSSTVGDADRYKELDRIAARIKHLALQLEIPIVCAVQLNREAEREGEPQKHHIADCKGIYNSADNVHLLQKPDTYLEDPDIWDGIVIVKTPKSRSTRSPGNFYYVADYARSTFEPVRPEIKKALQSPDARARLSVRRGRS